MAVEATPVIKPKTTDVCCADQVFKDPSLYNFYGNPLVSRKRAVVTNAGTKSIVRWTMLNTDGLPVDLTTCGLPVSEDGTCETSESLSSSESVGEGECKTSCVVLCFREYMSFGRQQAAEEPIKGIVTDAGNGMVEFELPKDLCPGIYWAEAAVMNCDCPMFSNVFCLVINRGLFSQARPMNNLGPPTIAEIRLFAADSHADESLLQDGTKWDDAEIAACIVRPVDYWNEVPPPLMSSLFTTDTFPFRFHWLEAILGSLFLISAERFRANHLPYSASGVSIDDQAKFQLYEEVGRRKWAEYKAWVRHKKAEINLNEGYGVVGSPYGNINGYFTGRGGGS
jgi:hypothetical protein